MKNKPGNRLAGEKSPYLQQHAHNPVDWYPWGPEAFERARREDKPIFLSIGYSTCHWCHVMERESFEDPGVASLMNEAFISIKVDREERPDIDAQYMAVCQMLTQGGGWPLTIIMTPDKKPFYAGTYFPRETKYGRIGLMDLVPRIKEIWQRSRAETLNNADKITDALRKSTRTAQGSMPGEDQLHTAFKELSQRFDGRNGGFGRSPKFPTPHNLVFLLRYWKRTGNSAALSMVEDTLQSMRRGGIFDQVGFGFHRYSTDEKWLVPHFEKMLYDQALIATAFLETFQATGKEEYARAAREIFTYCLRDMRSPQGGFFSAEDADSEGQEGKFYLWDYGEIRQALPEDGADLFIEAFNISKNGNFSDEAGNMPRGMNILHQSQPGLPSKKTPELENKLESARQRLLSIRNQRVHPMKDKKVLADWNGLMIAALALGARVLGEEEYCRAAGQAAVFILDKMKTPEGRLLHRYFEGESALPATLDDYAFVVHGLLELYETTFDTRYLSEAVELNRQMMEHFRDKVNGGFYLGADDGEQLLVRQKEIYDGAIPSGNSVAALNLLRLGRITGNLELEEIAAASLKAFSSQIKAQPSTFTAMLAALDFAIGPSREILIVGELKSADTRHLLSAINRSFVPNKIIVFRPADSGSSGIRSLAPWAAGQNCIDGKATAYVCNNFQCNLPTTDESIMLKLINSGTGEGV
jgi:uncharacterized protein